MEIDGLIMQSVPDVIRTALNAHGFADYYWSFDESFQMERKQPAEIIADMDGVEEQLTRQIAANPDIHLILCVEGIAMPHYKGIQISTLQPNGKFWRQGKVFETPYARYARRLIDWQNAGITVWQTPHIQATAILLVHLYKATEAGETQALQRNLKRRPVFQQNPYVQTLMGIRGADIGVVLAERLLAVFDTPIGVVSASPETIAEYVQGMSTGAAKKMLRAMGRNV